MSLVDLCKKGNLEGVKAALQRGVGVNTKDKTGKTGLVWAVEKSHNSVVTLLLDTPNVDLNLKTSRGGNCALLQAVRSKNNEALKLLLNVPTIDVNVVSKSGWSAVHLAVDSKNYHGLDLLLDVPGIDVNIVASGAGESALHRAVIHKNIEVLKQLLSHPSLTALTLNQKDKDMGVTPVMLALKRKRWKHLEVLAADPRVDLDTTDKEGRSLEEVGPR